MVGFQGQRLRAASPQVPGLRLQVSLRLPLACLCENFFGEIRSKKFFLGPGLRGPLVREDQVLRQSQIF